jgi:hypothetical protein
VNAVQVVERTAAGAMKLPMSVPRYTATVEFPFGVARYTNELLDPGFCWTLLESTIKEELYQIPPVW